MKSFKNFSSSPWRCRSASQLQPSRSGSGKCLAFLLMVTCLAETSRAVCTEAPDLSRLKIQPMTLAAIGDATVQDFSTDFLENTGCGLLNCEIDTKSLAQTVLASLAQKRPHFWQIEIETNNKPSFYGTLEL